MNGRGARWLRRLRQTPRWCPANGPNRRVLPCSTRSLSHQGCLLSRVTRGGAVSGSVDAAPDKSRRKARLGQGKAHSVAPEICDLPDDTTPAPWWPIREQKDAEGRTYFVSGNDWSYHCRHDSSMEGGHVKAVYTARGTYLNPSTKCLEYQSRIKRPLVIMYNYNFVEDDQFWDEVCALCDFATAVTEREKSREGYSPEKDSTPVEFIYVQARFHYNAERPEEPWHITVDFGNRKTWNNGTGFFRDGYHIYTKNNDLSQGYAGYSSPHHRSLAGWLDPEKNKGDTTLPGRKGDVLGSPTSLDNTGETPWVPWGRRAYYRHPKYRNTLLRTIDRSLEPPNALPELRARQKLWARFKNPTTGVREKVEKPGIQEELDDMIRCIRDGASKSATPSREEFSMQDLSGNWVHVRQAVSDMEKTGKEVPSAWRSLLKYFHAMNRRRRKTHQPAFGTRIARPATERARRTKSPSIRPRKGSPESKKLDRTDKLSRSQPKLRASLDGVGVREDPPGTARPEFNGNSTSKGDGGVDPKSRLRGSAGPPKPKKSETVKRASRPKLTIRDPFDTGAGAHQGVPAPGKLGSKAASEMRPRKSADDGELETKGRPRTTMRLEDPIMKRLIMKRLDLGQALLNVATGPEVSPQHSEGPKANKFASGEGSARPRPRRSQKSSLGKLLLEEGSPVSDGSGQSPRAPGSRDRKSRLPWARKSGGDIRKSGEQTSSPLPPADADVVLKKGKKIYGSHTARRPRPSRAVKPTPAWVEPRGREEAAAGEIHA